MLLHYLFEKNIVSGAHRSVLVLVERPIMTFATLINGSTAHPPVDSAVFFSAFFCLVFRGLKIVTNSQRLLLFFENGY